MGDPFPLFRLLVLSGPDGGAEFPSVDGEIVVGRDEGCTAPLKDPAVSRRHARLRATAGGGLVVEDLGSRNGTWLDGRTVTVAELDPGLILRIGASDCTVVDDGRDGLLGDEPSPDTTRFLPRRRLEDASELGDRSRRDLAILATAARSLAGHASPRPLVRALLPPLVQALGASAAAVWRRRGPRRLHLVAEVGAGASPSGRANDGCAIAESPPRRNDDPAPARTAGEGAKSRTATAEATWPSALVRDAMARDLPALALDDAFYLVAPLRCDEASFGALALRGPLDAPWSEKELELLHLVADLVAPALEAVELRCRLGRDRARLLSLMREGCELVGSSPAMEGLREDLARLAAVDTAVLLRGESGTGKELAARAIHFHGPRGGEAFVAVNCAALAPSLLEAELFGHERGAFTGAEGRRRGKLELAHGGTLFLDEVGELPPEAQASLLRALETKRFHRVGGADEVEVDLRVVAATHRDLEAEIRAGRFREDLFYRLAVVSLVLPPLRERPEDLDPLLEHFVADCSRRIGRPATARFTEAAKERLRAHLWPGNVRELRNLVERALVLHDEDLLGENALPAPLGPEAFPPRPRADEAPESLRALEARHVARTLAYTGGNKTRAAELLGVERATLYAMIERHGL